MEYITTQPLSPAAPYIGGKKNLADALIARIDCIDHATFAEPFVGMGGVFFRRTRIPKAEVINDISRDVSNFFRILQRHYVPFIEMMRFQLTTRVEFERLKNTNPDTLTDLERAARFLYMQRTSFGGKVDGRVFGVSADRPGRFDIVKLGPMLEDLHTRLSSVVIENLGYSDFISRYDKPATLFYLDPPYWGCEGDYGKNVFSREDFLALANQLQGISGKFILSLNDTEGVRKTFENFHMETVETVYTLAKSSSKIVNEVIISNVETSKLSYKSQPELF